MSSLMSHNGLPPQNHKQNNGNYGNYNTSNSNSNGNNNKFDASDINVQPQRGGEVAMISNVDTMKLANSALNTQSKYLIAFSQECIYPRNGDGHRNTSGLSDRQTQSYDSNVMYVEIIF